MDRPTVVAVSGVKNSGKTTLIEGMLPYLNGWGLSVAVIKHDGHTFDPDPAQTDTGRHFRAGACGVAIFDGEKVKVVRRSQEGVEHLIRCFPDADLILLEGFKGSHWPKLEVIRRGNSRGAVCDPTTLLALVTDGERCGSDIPHLGLSDWEGAAKVVADYMKKQKGESGDGSDSSHLYQ